MSFQAVNEWPSETRRSRYPFVETASLRDVSGILSLEDPLVLECQVWAPMGAMSRVYISAVARTSTGLLITLSSLDQELGVATVLDLAKSRAAFRNARGAQVGFLRVAPGGFARLYDNPSATYRFTAAATELVASALHSRPTGGMSALRVGDTLVEGDIRLVGGEGTRLRVVDGKVLVDQVGDPFFARDTCRDAQQSGLAINPVRRIVVSDTRQTYVVVPKLGQVGVRVISAPGNAQDKRSLVSPGPNGEVIATLLPA